MKKKITYKEWTEIGKLNHAAKWLRPLCTYQLIKESDTIFKREQYLNMCIYCILFIPVHILQAIILLFDGGLKEFVILERQIGYDILTKGSLSYEKAKCIWAKHSKTKKLIINKR